MQFQTNIVLVLIFLNFVLFAVAVEIVANGSDAIKCEHDDECNIYNHSEFEVSSICNKGYCLCSVQKLRSIKCFTKDEQRNHLVFGPCPCVMPNARCTRNFCECKSTYLPTEDMRSCTRKAIPVGHPCSINEECQMLDPFAFCEETVYKRHVLPKGVEPPKKYVPPPPKNHCECIHNFINTGGYCRALVGSRGYITAPHQIKNCDNNGMCYAAHPYSECDFTRQLCVCERGFVNDDSYGECHRGAKWGEWCDIDMQCHYHLGLGSRCVKGKCRCKPPYVTYMEPNVNTSKPSAQCKMPAELGEVCQKDDDCHNPDLKTQTMECYMLHKRCACKEGFYSKNNVTCNRDVTLRDNLGLVYVVIAFQFLNLF